VYLGCTALHNSFYSKEKGGKERGEGGGEGKLMEIDRLNSKDMYSQTHDKRKKEEGGGKGKREEKEGKGKELE